MLRPAAAILALALGAALAVGVASCGGGDEGLLPGDNAQQIVDNLDQVEQDAGAGNCDDALASAEEIHGQVEDLGPGVNTQLRQRLLEGVNELVRVINSSCEAATTTTTTTEETTTEETTDETTTQDTTEKTTTTTTEPTTTTTTTAPTTSQTTTGGGVVAPPGGGGGGGP